MGLITQIGADASVYNQVLATMPATANRAVAGVTSSFNRAGQAGQQMGNSVSRGSNQAGMALVDLGRIAQDSPFGFIGIQNNLNPMLESFRRLRAESGSTGGALRSLLTGLTGAGGLGVALSIVTAAATFAQIGFSRWFPSINKTTQALKENKKAIDEQVDSAAGEISKLDELYDATQNINLPLSQRLTAIKELKKEYPSYFGNMDKEAILAGKAATAYDNLTRSIIQQAVVKAGQDELSDQLKPLIKILAEQEKLFAKYEKQRSDLFKKTGKVLDAPTGGFFIDNSSSAKNKGDIQTIDNYKKELQDKIKETRDGIQKSIETFGINSLIKPEKVKADTKAAKTAYELLEAEIKKIENAIEDAAAKGNTGLLGGLNEQLSEAEKKLAAIDEIIRKSRLAGTGETITSAPAANNIQSDDGGIFNTSGIVAYMTAQQKLTAARKADKDESDAQVKSFNDMALAVQSFVGLVGGSLISTFESILVGTQSFVSGMAQLIGQLIGRLVAAAAAAAVLAVIISVVPGFGGGGLSTAFGKAGQFKSLFSSFSGVKLAEGGITNGPTRALIGEGREREVVTPLSKLPTLLGTGNAGGNIVMHKIQGNDLLIWIDRANKQKGRIG